MGKSGETCGAVTGAVMVLSLKYGTADANDLVSKEKVSRSAWEFIKRFRERNSHSACRDLLGFDIGSSDMPYKEKKRAIAERCPRYVRDAAVIIDEILRG